MEKKISQENILINVYFMFMDTTDILLREIEHMIKAKSNNMALKGETKMYHNRMMQTIKLLKANYEAYYTKTQWDSFGKDYDRMDDLRRSANYMIRLALLITDRTYHDESLEEVIEKFISEMSDNGFIDKDIIERFIMKTNKEEQ